MDGEALATFLGVVLTLVVFTVFAAVFIKIAKSAKENQRAEEYKRKKAAEEASTRTTFSAEERRAQSAATMKRIAQSFGLYVEDEEDDEEEDEDEVDTKHQKHVADSHAHGHVGEEEHYEEIVGSLGEINDEGCADLSGVRFLANDLAYEIKSNEAVDYDRLAQAMVLGEIVNSPRFKTPYTRRK